MTTYDTLTNRLTLLKKSPVAAMSLASKELFHSNFIGFLLEQYPKLIKPLFGEIPNLPDKPEVHREKDNIDLMIGPPSQPDLIVENKVKSIPDKSQLERYGEKYSASQKVLLSLMRPAFTLEEVSNGKEGYKPWTLLLYDELLKRLRQSFPILTEPSPSDYHRSLVDDYCNLLETLIAIRDMVAITTDNLDEAFLLDHEQAKLFQNARMWDLAQKIRYASFVEFCYRRLQEFALADLALTASAGLTRSVGLADFKLKIGPDETAILLGIQIQGYQYRYIVEDWRGTREGKQYIKSRKSEDAPPPKLPIRDMTDLARSLFDAGIMGETTHPKAANEFNQFGKGFKYRSRLLGPSDKVANNPTVRELANTVADDFKRIAEDGPSIVISKRGIN